MLSKQDKKESKYTKFLFVSDRGAGQSNLPQWVSPISGTWDKSISMRLLKISVSSEMCRKYLELHPVIIIINARSQKRRK